MQADVPARDRYVEIPLAGLVMSVASLDPGSTVLVSSKGEAAQRERLERRVRVEVRELDASAAPEQRDRIIEVVVGELMSPDDGPT